MTPRSLLHPARLARKPVLSTQSDERLVDLVRAGYEPAFETIVERYRRPLTGYVRRILPAERAEDAVQQTFVNAYEAIRRDDAELKLRPWLYRIAHNTALNGLRDRGPSEQPLDERVDGVERPDQAFERRQGLAQVIAAVQDLPERQRDAIVLRELEGRSYAEISAALGVSGGAVRQLLNRARATLRAAATAVTPVGLLTRFPWAVSAEPVGARVADICGVSAAAGTSALAAQVCATALVTGAVVGGVAVLPSGGDDPRERGIDRAQATDRRGSGVVGAAGGPAAAGAGDAGFGRTGTTDKRDRDDHGRGGPERGGGANDRDASADRRGDDRGPDDSGDGDGPAGDPAEQPDDRSGHGGGAEAAEPDEDRSGPGGGDPDDDAAGALMSGSGVSGGGGDGSSGTSGSGSSGSGGSGSGSGSGSGLSGLGSSGSGSSSGPGSSGPSSGSSGPSSGSSGPSSGSSGPSSGDGSGSGSGSGLDELEAEAG